MPTVIRVVSVFFQVYKFLILIRVLLTWVNISPYHPVIQLLHRITDPILHPIRRLVPAVGGTLDLSPVVALILLEVVQRVLISVLSGLYV
ncbi:YggT family protein [Chloroflexota bacterium]